MKVDALKRSCCIYISAINKFMVERMSYSPTIIGMNPKPFIDMATLMKLEWVIKIIHEMN